MFFYVKVSSKNKKSLNLFLKFLSLVKIKIPCLVVSSFPKINKKKFLTVLKSPHVNKTAQEQFEFKFYSKKFLVLPLQHKKFIYIIKKINSHSFFDINIEIKVLVNNRFYFKSLFNNLNPNETNTDFFNLKLPSIIKHYKVKKYCQLLDSYGEFYLKKIYF